jgi:serine/threonine protein kinase
MPVSKSSPVGASGFRFKVRAPLRCDGVGRLDVGEDLHTGARLAIRWIPVAANGIAAMAQCDALPQHPALPRIVQTGVFQGQAFIAIAFPEGQALSTLLGNRLETALVLQLGEQLLSALSALHSVGIVHGELSAESVLVASPGRTFLWDAPLVLTGRLSDRRDDHRINQHLTKIAAYLSPERAKGAGATPADDVFAAAALICAAGGATSPLTETALGVVYHVSTGAFRWTVPPTFPNGWRDMLERMLSEYPSERPSAAEALARFTEPLSANALHTLPEMPALQLESMLGHFRRKNPLVDAGVVAEHITQPENAQFEAPPKDNSLTDLPSAPQSLPPALPAAEEAAFGLLPPSSRPSRTETARPIPVLHPTPLPATAPQSIEPAMPLANAPVQATQMESDSILFAGLSRPPPSFLGRYWWLLALLAVGLAAALFFAT